MKARNFGLKVFGLDDDISVVHAFTVARNAAKHVAPFLNQHKMKLCRQVWTAKSNGERRWTRILDTRSVALICKLEGLAKPVTDSLGDDGGDGAFFFSPSPSIGATEPPHCRTIVGEKGIVRSNLLGRRSLVEGTMAHVLN